MSISPRAEYNRAWYNMNNNRHKKKMKMLFKEYGITEEEYISKLEEQDHSCFICKKHKSNFKRALHVDHNHTTGQIRSLLCSGCNRRVAVVENGIKDIKEYLELWDTIKTDD